MTTSASNWSLTESEIDFLRELSSSDLRKLLASYPTEQRKQIRQELKSRPTNRLPKNEQQKNGEQKKQRERNVDAGTAARTRYARKERLALQDISPLPAELSASDKRLRKKLDASLLDHLTHCYPRAFTIPFSDDHLRLISEIENTCKAGQLKALAMPRGSGKTTIVTRAALWSLLTGLRRFCVVVAATENAATSLLDNIKIEIASNPILAKLYARELHALKSLDGESRRSQGQRFESKKTNVQWLADRISFGNVPGVTTSGSVLNCCGITGNIRGQQIATSDGTILRPDLVLIDDPQTSESAASPSQCNKRYEIMLGDILGMSGPGKTISAICAMTVVYQNDLADRLLNRKLSPVWRGEKCSMIYAWPNERGRELWDAYREHYEDDLREGSDGSVPRQFVEENFEELHAGSSVAWEHRKNPDEVSALQHAYHLRFRDEAAFAAEYQNEPLSARADLPFNLNVETLLQKTNGVKRLAVPEYCEKLTTFIDVQNNVLFFMSVAWELTGRGHVIDYGTFPDQRRIHFSKQQIEKTLQKRFRTDNLNEAIYQGLGALTKLLFSRKYKRLDGAVMSMDRVAVDARSGFHTRTVRRFCRESNYVGRIHPHFGQFIGKDSRQWASWQHKKGDRLGLHCRLQPPPKNTRGVREILVDTNFWKTTTAEKLEALPGSDSSILFFESPPARHRMLAEHLVAETPVREFGKAGNSVVVWKQDFNSRDNDYWDCLVGNCVLASVEGIGFEIEPDPSEARQQKKTKRRNKRTNRDFVGF